MLDPTILDGIIESLGGQKMIGSDELAKKFGVGQDYIIAGLRQIENYYPGAFEEAKGYSGAEISISLTPRFEEQLLFFVKNGGFVAQYRDQRQVLEKQEHKNNLEIIHLESAVKAAESAEKNAKSSRNAAWVAAFAGVAVIVWEIIKTLRGIK